MKFSIDNKILIDSLNILMKAVSSKTTIEILKGIYIEAKDNELILKTYNSELAITINIEAVIHAKGAFVIEARLLNEIIRKLPNEIITFTKVNEKLNIKCLSSDYNLKVYNYKEFPQLPDVKSNEKIKINRAIFSNMIRYTNFAVSKDESKISLTGSLVKIKENKLTVVSIDGYSIAKKTVDINSERDMYVIVPGRTLAEIQKIVENNFTDDLEIIIENNYIAFIIDNIKIISKVIEGPYVDYEKYISKKFEMNIEIDRRELLNAIDRAALMANSSKSYVIIMEFEQDKLTILTNTQLGKTKDEIKIKNDKEFKIGLNPNYLLKGLKVIEDDNINVLLETSTKPFLIKPKDDDNYEYYIVPVRVR